MGGLLNEQKFLGVTDLTTRTNSVSIILGLDHLGLPVASLLLALDAINLLLEVWLDLFRFWHYLLEPRLPPLI